MKLYWPCAVYVDKNGKEEYLSTYESHLNLDRARNVFRTWRQGYGFKLIRCWIDVYENGNKIGFDKTLFIEATRYALQYCNREGRCWKMEKPDCPFIDICHMDVEQIGEHRKDLFFESSFVARYLELIGG